MKIVQFAASEGYGGMESIFVALSNCLAENHDVTALLIRGCEYKERFSEKVKLVEIEVNPTKLNPLLYWQLYRNIFRIRPDIVHTHAAKGSRLVLPVCRFLGIPHVGTKHNDRNANVFNSLDWVVAVSKKVQQSVHLRPGGIVEVIYNGVAEQSVLPAAQNEIFTILAVGRLDRIKGFDLLIDQVKKLDFSCRLLIAGEGPQYRQLSQQITELNLQDVVSLVGFRNDISQMMHDSHLVVIPSHREGFSNVIVEALFYAPLLVSTPVGVAPEILPDRFQTSQSGLAGKITDIFNNYADYTTRFEQLREKQKEHFRLADTIRHYERFYLNILNS